MPSNAQSLPGPQQTQTLLLHANATGDLALPKGFNLAISQIPANTNCSTTLRVDHLRRLRIHKYSHLPRGIHPLIHHLMSSRCVIKIEHCSKARIDLPSYHHIIECYRLFVIGTVRTLDAFLPRPKVTKIGNGIVPRRPRTYHYHSSSITYKHGRGHRRFARVLKNDFRAPSLT